MLTTAAILVLATFVTCGTAYYGGSPVLEAMAEPVPDYETTSYLLPRLVAKYRAPHSSQGDWESASDPRMYLLTELDSDASQAATRRVKRTGGGPSLSIVNPLDVLRQRLLLEIARRRMRQSQDQIQANRDFLQSIGKREVANRTDNEIADYIISPAVEKSGIPAHETNRSPESPEWSAAPVSRWNNEYNSLHQS